MHFDFFAFCCLSLFVVTLLHCWWVDTKSETKEDRKAAQVRALNYGIYVFVVVLGGLGLSWAINSNNPAAPAIKENIIRFFEMVFIGGSMAIIGYNGAVVAIKFPQRNQIKSPRAAAEGHSAVV